MLSVSLLLDLRAFECSQSPAASFAVVAVKRNAFAYCARTRVLTDDDDDDNDDGGGDDDDEDEDEDEVVVEDGNDGDEFDDDGDALFPVVQA